MLCCKKGCIIDCRYSNKLSLVVVNCCNLSHLVSSWQHVNNRRQHCEFPKNLCQVETLVVEHSSYLVCIDGWPFKYFYTSLFLVHFSTLYNDLNNYTHKECLLGSKFLSYICTFEAYFHQGTTCQNLFFILVAFSQLRLLTYSTKVLYDIILAVI